MKNKKKTWLQEIKDETEGGEKVKWTEWWHINFVKHSTAHKNLFNTDEYEQNLLEIKWAMYKLFIIIQK